MMDPLRTMPAPHPPGNEDETRLRELIRLVALLLLGGGIITSLHHALAGHWRALGVLLSGGICVVSALWLNGRGFQNAAIRLILFSLLLTTAGLVCSSAQGFRDVAALGYPSVLAVGGLLLHRRSFVGLSLMTVGCAVGSWLAGAKGWIATPAATPSSPQDLTDATIILVMTAAVAGVFGERLRQSLAQAREHGAALRGAEDRFQALFEQSPDCVYHCDLEGRFLDANPATLALLGYERGEISSLSYSSLLPADQVPKAARAVDEVKATGTSKETLVLNLRRKNGAYVEVEARWSLLRRDGKAYAIQGIARDLSERKRTESRSDLLVQALKCAPDAISITTLDDNFLFVNDAFLAAYGYTEEELLGRSVGVLRRPSQSAEATARIQPATLRGGWHGELINRRKDGSEFPIELWTSMVRDKSGEPMAMVGFARDITERKQAEEALRLSEAQLRASLENTPNVAVQWFDETGRVLYWNPASESLYGWMAQDAMGKTLDELIYDRESAAEFVRMLSEIGAAGKPMGPYESEFRRRDGTSGWLISTTFGMPAPEGKKLFVCMDVDITESKKVQAALDLERRFFEGLFEALPGHAYVLDEQGRFVRVNRNFEESYGTDWKGKSLFDSSGYIHPDHRQDVSQGIRRAFEIGHYSNEFIAVRKDGVEVPRFGTGQTFVFDGKRYGVGVTLDISERVQAEKALRDSEKRLEIALGVAQGGVWEADLRTGQVFLDHKFLLGLGYAKNELRPTSDSLRVLVHPEDQPRLKEVFEDLLRGRSEVVEAEYRILKKDGSWVWVTTHGRVVERGPDGTPWRVIGAQIDVTQRRRAEEALRASEQRMRLFFERQVMGMAITSPEKGWIVVNDRLCQMLGRSREELLQMTWSEVTHPDDLAADLAQFQRLLAGEIQDYSLEKRFLRKDGAVVSAALSVGCVRRPDGSVDFVLALLRDITEHKRVEAEVHRLKNYLANIIDSMPSVLIGADMADLVTEWNRQAEVVTGIRAEEAIGRPLPALLPEFSPWIKALRDEIQQRRPASREKLLLVQNGERRFYDVMMYPLAANCLEGVVLRIENVTERVRIQEMMVQTEKMMSLGGLAAGMAHEINNPLGIITQAAQNIERRVSVDLPANRKAAEELGLDLGTLHQYLQRRAIPQFIRDIRDSCDRASRIVANMLRFSRKSEANRQTFSLSEVLERALELAANDYDLKKRYDFRTIQIVREFEADLPAVPLVIVEMEQVLLNLIKNAAQAMEANPPERKPCLILRLRRADPYLAAEIEDNGPGMDERVLSRIFEPFFTTKDPGVGTGLGLSVSYTIVTQNHKGLIAVDSTPGHGACFTVKLPLQ